MQMTKSTVNVIRVCNTEGLLEKLIEGYNHLD